jgi:hypothetical protein
MAFKDYVRQVAKAYAENDPQLESLAQKALAEIDEARSTLQTQAYAIKQLLAVAHDSGRPMTEFAATNPVVQAPETVPVFTDNGRGLTEQLKERVRTVWREEIQRTGRDLEAPQVVELLRSQGVTFDVDKPHAAVGTVLFALRKAYARTGQIDLTGP